MQVERIQQHIVKKSDSDFKMLDEMCFKSKNLYNAALYVVRQALTGKTENIKEYADLIKDGKYIAEYDLSKRMAKLKQIDYVSMDKIQSSQQVLKLLFRNMTSFYRASKSYFTGNHNSTGRPKLPNYKPKNGRNIVIFTNQSCKVKNRELYFTKFKKLHSLKTDIQHFQQFRIIHKGYYIKLEIVYLKEINEHKNLDFQHSAGIDLGINNLAAITSDNGMSLIVNGRSLKSINQFYNKKTAKLASVYSAQKLKTGKKLQSLNLKRNCKITDYMHKSTRFIVEQCVKNKIKDVYIGHNKGWKQETKLGTMNNQNFVQIPFSTFIQMLKYKLEAENISLHELNEAYSSKCSFVDDEAICKHDVYMGKRIKRGLFKPCAHTGLINADINGSLNILKLGMKAENKQFKTVFKTYYNPMMIKTMQESADVRNDQAVETVVLQPVASNSNKEI